MYQKYLNIIQILKMMASKQLNTLFLADGYKISHHLQYPPGTTTIFSYFESRGGKWDKTVFFGLQYILKYISIYVGWWLLRI